MEVQQLAICDKCKNHILPNNGFIIQGNVYAIKEDLQQRGGIIGNAFPLKEGTDLNSSPHDTKFTSAEIKEYAYHTDCLDAILNAATAPNVIPRGFISE